jgi:hypothetical protein
MRGQELPGDRALEGRKPDARVAVAAKQELVQPIGITYTPS